MNRLILRGTDIPFDFSGWESQSLIQVAAGTDCLMALTPSGHVLKLDMKEPFRRTLFHRRAESILVHELCGAKEIAVSKCYPELASAVLRNGRCAVSFGTSHIPHRDCQRIHQTVSGWENLVQTAVSDAIFALHEDGTVSCAPIRQETDDYAQVRTWTNVKRIVPGLQNSLFGIREDGSVLCAGANLTRGPHGDISARWKEIRNVVDVCATGSECETVLYLTSDGWVRGLTDSGFTACQVSGNRLVSHFSYTVFAGNGEPVFHQGNRNVGRLNRVISLDLGDRNGFQNVFLAALVQE